MKETINFSQFTDRFKSLRPDNFSYEGLRALYDYLEDYEEGTGEEIELDVIALCCEFIEYESLEEFHNDYAAENYPNLETLGEHTQVINVKGNGFIIQQF